MKTTKLAIAALVGVLAFGLGQSVNAQGLNLQFGKHKRGKHFGLNINLPLGGHNHGGHNHGGHGHFPPPCPPVHVHSSCCFQVTPGHYETVQERIWVPGVSQQVWEQPVYRTEYDHCGNPIQVLVRAGYYRTICTPGHWDLIQKQVFVPGAQQLICGL